ncbi:MAG: hypothetical protein P4L99_21670 [Chthoniobacter sp.]|nr:hypothetical protein [Chthoniobacter sp.]
MTTPIDPHALAYQSFQKAQEDYWNLAADERAKTEPPIFDDHLDAVRKAAQPAKPAPAATSPTPTPKPAPSLNAPPTPAGES